MTGPVFGLAFDPRALTDLLEAPAGIRDLALAQLEDVVAGRLHGAKLVRELAGARKLYIDPSCAWRIVYQQRPAPAGSAHRSEIYVVAVRPRARHDVYTTARERLGLPRKPTDARSHAARTRPPQFDAREHAPAPPAQPRAVTGGTRPDPRPARG
ncbi:hypothetical protein [Actinacidiphila sp. bgisy144]|uniref:hypothetical protein n=1 Tax=Actinacidiphila sp. bgisy144 TaxID=3413791 RepID=UPI003EC0901F